MLKELFESIWAKGQEGIQPKCVQIPGTKKVIVSDGDGGSKTYDQKPGRKIERGMTVKTLSDLAGMLLSFRPIAQDFRNDFDFEVEEIPPEITSTIWVDDSNVVAVADDYVGAHKIVCPLEVTPQFDELVELDSAFSLVDIIKFLRITLDGTDADSYIPKFRDIKFQRSNAFGGKTSHTDESMGRDIENKVVSGQDLPETLKLNVRVFSNMDIPFTAPIRVFVTLNFQSETIQLTTAPDDIRQAKQKAMDFVRDRVQSLVESEETITVTTGRVNI
ncbi:MAG: hypothetical protein R3C03_24100 [Pirellulaceae bacterium]